MDAYRERLDRLYADYGPQSATAQHGRHELFAHPVSLIALKRQSSVRSRFALAARRRHHYRRPLRQRPVPEKVIWAGALRRTVLTAVHQPVSQRSSAVSSRAGTEA